MLGDLNDRIRILRMHDFTTDDRIASTITEHLEILGCVLSRDPTRRRRSCARTCSARRSSCASAWGRR